LANCPFQFYLRHVLKLEPTEEPEELDEDYTARGQLIHAALEKMHLALHRSNQPDVPLTRLVHEVVELFVERELEGWLPPASDVDEGLRAIESERLRRTGRRYARQFEEYQKKLGQGATCQQCEVEFGRPNADFPALRLGNENDGLGLQGMIDRIDTVEVDGSTLFRVIDYKTGSCPGRGELNAGLALQLPLYALAVERLILADVGAEPFDVGYWGLRDKGFRPIDQRIKIRSKGTSVDENWAQNLQAAETFVVELVKRLRAAEFPVAPRKDQCTRTCEYKNVCRIGQVRVLKKTWVDAPALKRST
ncbi:MAG TPA: PD-(D/E)XK nuclease family protein, partial [Isosphaeraceae bacterium]|nr:PD-(D/E)XK nuclease family protein [Isosphaeraceae bacterium]